MAISFRPAAPIAAEAALPMALVRQQLKLDDGADQDLLVAATRLAALTWVEKHSGFSLQRRPWVARFDEPCPELRLPMGPVSGVTAITYRSPADVQLVHPATSYRLRGDIIEAASGPSWLATFGHTSIIVDYEAGFANIATDAAHLQVAALILLMHLWTGGSLDDVPATVTMLCEPDRMPVISS